MDKFNQLCMLPGTIVGQDEIQDFENFFENEVGVRVKYECEVLTLPNLDDEGNAVEETGGRNDLFFYIHDEDIQKFAVRRLTMGIRWWEDVIKYNDNSHMYTQEFISKYPTTW